MGNLRLCLGCGGNSGSTPA